MSYFMPYFDNFMKKIGVTCEKLVLSKLTKYQKFTVRSCYLHGSQRSTEHILFIFAVFRLKFPSNILFHDIFDILMKNWAISTKRDRYEKN